MVIPKNGKFLGTMRIVKGEYLVSHPLSKSLYFRKTKKDQYLLYSNGSELLVFDKDTWERTIINSLPDLEKNSELYKLLEESLFFERDGEIPCHNTRYLQILRTFIVILGIVSFTVIFTKIRSLSFLTYDFKNENLTFVVLFAVVFSILTTIFHEIMHILFSNNFKGIAKSLRFSLKKSVATVNLTHVWFWPLFSRAIAILGGVITDSIILASLFLASDRIASPLLTLFIYIMLLRILWQFRLYNSTDGRLLLFMLIDNPLLKIEYEIERNSLSDSEKFLWRICQVISTIITIVIYMIIIFFLLKIMRYI